MASTTFLAIDLGLRHGFAYYADNGDLLWYKSSRFPSKSEIKKTAYGILKELNGLHTIVLEGDKAIGEIWRKAADKLNITTIWVAPEVWRPIILHQREQRSGKEAKKYALNYAHQIIETMNEKSQIKRAVRLRNDEAEAILIGQWFLVRRSFDQLVE